MDAFDINQLMQNPWFSEYIHFVLGVPSAAGPFVAGLTFLLYDYLCTLDVEVAYVWTCPWTLGLPLFYINRYLPFVDMMLLAHIQISRPPTHSCTLEMEVASWLIFVGAIVSQTIIVMRTCAMWRGNTWVYGSTLLMLVSSISIMGFVTHLEVRDAHFVDLSFITPRLKCMLTNYSNVAKYAYVSIFTFEVVIVTLTVVRASQHLRRTNSSWVSQLYGQGIFYCICMTMLSLTNLLLTNVKSTPPFYVLCAAPLQRVFHSIFCNRVMFQILEHRTVMTRGDSTSRSSLTNIFSTIILDRDDPSGITSYLPSASTIDESIEMVSIDRTHIFIRHT